MASKRIPIHRKRMRSENANDSSNRVFGGHILAEIDEAAVFAAEQLSPSQQFVTVAFDRVIFKKKVLVRDILLFYTTITHIGNTSVKVHVEVETRRDDTIIAVTSADVTMVAIDENEKPTKVITNQRKRINKQHLDEHCTPVPKCPPTPATPEPAAVKPAEMRNFLVTLDIEYVPEIEGDRAATYETNMQAIAAFRSTLNQFLQEKQLKEKVTIVEELAYLGQIHLQTTADIAEQIRQLPGVYVVADNGAVKNPPRSAF